MPLYACLRKDLQFSETDIDGEKVVNIKDPITGNYFRLRQPEFYLISQLDGETSYETVAKRFKDKFELNITAEDVLGFVDILEENFFLENSRAEQKISRRSYGAKKKRSFSFSQLLFIKLKAFDPTKLLNKLVKLYKPFHSPMGFIVQALFILFGIGLFITHHNKFEISISEIYNVSSILTIVVVFFVLVTIHELSHAVVCRFYGGSVTEMGFLLLYLQPCCYCNLSDAWLFKKKRHRIWTMSAGLFSQFILLTIAMIVWRVTVPGIFINEAARLLVIVIWLTFLFNLNPLIKLDGYYLLSDYLEIPNLRKQAFSWSSNLFKRLILGWPIDKIEATPRQKRVFAVYTILALTYTVLLLGYIFYLLGSFIYSQAGYQGIFLFLLLIFYTLRTTVYSLFNGIVKQLFYMKDIMKRPIRLTIYLLVLIMFVTVMFFIKFPHRVTGEIAIRPIAEFSLQLNDFGLLEKKFRRGGAESEVKSSFLQMTSNDLASLDLVPFVRDAQKVAKGDTLAILVSNQVTRELISERSLLKKLNNDLLLLKAPPKKEEIDEAQSEVNAAQAVYDQKFAEEERVKKLFAKNLSFEKQIEQARSDVRVALAELENKVAKVELLKSPPKDEEVAVIRSEIEKQQAKLEFLRNQKDAQSIIAPIDGRVVINNETDAFLSIVDNSHVEVLIPVSDYDINLVWIGQEVRLKVRSFTDAVFDGLVVHVPQDATTNDDDETFFMVASVLDNGGNRLQKGMTGYAKIEVGEISLFELLLRRLLSILRVEFWSWW